MNVMSIRSMPIEMFPPLLNNISLRDLLNASATSSELNQVLTGLFIEKKEELKVLLQESTFNHIFDVQINK